MKKQIEGIIIQIDNDMAKIKVSRHNDCKNCGACPGNNAMVLDALNEIDAKVGQRVLVEVKEANMLKAAFVVYILPLVFVFIGALVGFFLAKKVDANVTLYQVIGGIIFFILSIFIIKLCDKSAFSSNQMSPTIIKVLF